MNMASDGTLPSSSTHEHKLDYNDHEHPHEAINLSRLSVCTTSCICGPEPHTDDIAKLYEIDEAGGMSIFMSRLSIETFEGDADDEEFSDEHKDYKERSARLLPSSDSEPGYYSLPATPPRIRRKAQALKYYASENEGKKCTRDSEICTRRSRSSRRRRIERRGWHLNGAGAGAGAEHYNTAGAGNEYDWMSKNKGEDNYFMTGSKNGYSGGESESGGVVLMARPKGGRRSLRMDSEEVKACRDLGLELEHHHMLEMPSCVSISAPSTVDTSSGGNSPIAHWRISSPGDDPRDVKARLKIWAQAVAFASASRSTSN